MDIEHIKKVKATADCLYDAAAIEAVLDNMARDIAADLQDKNPLLVCLMNGGLMVAGRLMAKLDFVLQIDFIHASRYREQTQGGAVLDWLVKPHQQLQGRHVLLVDDILDEGQTLYEVKQYCLQQGAAGVLTAVLADKKHDRRKPAGFVADYTGLSVEDRYVFGCGMDYKGYLRNVDGIYAVDDALLS